MNERGNLFANVEEEFILASEEEINEIMHNSWIEIWTILEELGTDNSTIGMFLMYGAMIGVSSKDGKLNQKEKELIDDSFGKVGNNDITIFYESISKRVVDEDYEKLKTMIETFPKVAISYLKFILSFAYIDGNANDKDMKKLENAFAMILMTNFFMSGKEDVRQPIRKVINENKSRTKSTTTSSKKNSNLNKSNSDELTKKIKEFFEKDDPFMTLEEIKRHFPNRTKEEIKDELSKLCDSGYLYQVDTITGNMYGKI